MLQKDSRCALFENAQGGFVAHASCHHQHASLESPGLRSLEEERPIFSLEVIVQQNNVDLNAFNYNQRLAQITAGSCHVKTRLGLEKATNAFTEKGMVVYEQYLDLMLHVAIIVRP